MLEKLLALQGRRLTQTQWVFVSAQVAVEPTQFYVRLALRVVGTNICSPPPYPTSPYLSSSYLSPPHPSPPYLTKSLLTLLHRTAPYLPSYYLICLANLIPSNHS